MREITKVAHDPGDPQVCAHCPFCGSGQIIGQSDGTIACEFCAMVFLVRVQPQFPGMPQAEGGEAPTDVGPDVPGGMMGGPMPPGMEDEGGFPPGEDDDEGFPPGEDGEDDEDGFPPGEDDEGSGGDDEEDGGEDGQPFKARDKREKGKKGKPFQPKKSSRQHIAAELPYMPEPDDNELGGHLHTRHGLDPEHLPYGDARHWHHWHASAHKYGTNHDHQHDQPRGKPLEENWPDAFHPGEDDPDMWGYSGGHRTPPGHEDIPETGSFIPLGQKWSATAEARRSYRTLNGDELPEDAYIRHLACLHGGPQVFARLRHEAARYSIHAYDSKGKMMSVNNDPDGPDTINFDRPGEALDYMHNTPSAWRYDHEEGQYRRARVHHYNLFQGVHKEHHVPYGSCCKSYGHGGTAQ